MGHFTAEILTTLNTFTKRMTYIRVDHVTSGSQDSDICQLQMPHIPQFQHSCRTHHY